MKDKGASELQVRPAAKGEGKHPFPGVDQSRRGSWEWFQRGNLRLGLSHDRRVAGRGDNTRPHISSRGGSLNEFGDCEIALAYTETPRGDCMVSV